MPFHNPGSTSPARITTPLQEDLNLPSQFVMKLRITQLQDVCMLAVPHITQVV